MLLLSRQITLCAVAFLQDPGHVQPMASIYPIKISEHPYIHFHF